MELKYMKKALSLEQYRKMYTGFLILRKKLYIENYFDKKSYFLRGVTTAATATLSCVLDGSFFFFLMIYQNSEAKLKNN